MRRCRTSAGQGCSTEATMAGWNGSIPPRSPAPPMPPLHGPLRRTGGLPVCAARRRHSPGQSDRGQRLSGDRRSRMPVPALPLRSGPDGPAGRSPPVRQRMLPVFTSFDGGATMAAIAAAGGGPVPQRGELRAAWRHRLDSSRAPPRGQLRHGRARLGDQVLDVRDHADAFAHGFRSTLTALGAHARTCWRQAALWIGSAASPAACCARPPISMPWCWRGRSTAARPQPPTSSPPGSPVPRGRPPLIGIETVWRKVLQAEAAALARLDVPAFTFLPAERSARPVEGGTLGDAFASRCMGGRKRP